MPCLISPARAKRRKKVTQPPKPLTDAELADGWISLFDGETLFGWKAAQQGRLASEGRRDLCLRRRERAALHDASSSTTTCSRPIFGAAKNTNSGIFLRTAPVVGMNDITTKCYELNIAPPDNPFPTGGFVGRLKGKAVPERDGEWQSFEVTLDGAKSTVKLNGETVLEYTDPKPVGRGYIGLQLNEGQCEFKNIKLKPLGLEPLFNGKDLTGWKNHPESKSTFTVNDKGEIHVTSTGRGALESEKQFGDFVLQMEAISHARAQQRHVHPQHSGRIHQRLRKPDSQRHQRRRPHAAERFWHRRHLSPHPARLVVPNDKEWFHKTIVADGPHISVWVNGYQVTDWTDDRKPDKNPRNGLRTEAGTLQLQGHDPTTDLSFRNIKARELAKNNGN